VFTRSLAFALVVSAVSLPVALLACGDKFLVPSRGTRFATRVVDRGAATVLLYARSGSALDETMRAQVVEARLRAAGYRPTSVTSPEIFASLLRSTPWDVVVTDLSDAAAVVAGDLSGRSPIVLPVAHQLPKTTLDHARRQYRHVLKLPFEYQTLLLAIDDVIANQGRRRDKPTTRSGD
jgi:hypothetical protein